MATKTELEFIVTCILALKADVKEVMLLLLLLLLLLLHLFNSFFSRTTWVSQHQKGKPFWILTKQEMMGWQWH